MVEVLERLRQGLGPRYTVDREIGHGGMAVVFRAEDHKLHRPVAIKVLRPEIAAALGADRFLREIDIVASLTHPNILPLHDSGELSGKHAGTASLLYYVMPYVEGETLRDRLSREHQLPLEDALQITTEVADALGYAHATGLVHRDIKPENVLFQAGHAMVSDFGIARAVSQAGGESLTASGIAVGTVSYMSPEQAAGRKDVDGRSDLYSLGCMLYEMLAGQMPLGPSASADFSQGPGADLRRSRENVPQSMAQVIGKVLSRNPADRFTTASQFSEALRVAASGPVPERAGTSVRSRLRVAVLVGLLAVGGAVVIPRLLTSGAQSLRLAVLPFANMTGDSTQDYFSDGLTEEMITQLGHLAPGRLGVIAPATAMRYRRTEKPVDQIGRELGVQYLLAGKVRREGDRVRVTTQLVRIRDQTEIWSDVYERDLRSILAVQSEIAQRVADSLALALLPGERRRLLYSRPINPEAYEAYLRGREHNAKLSRADLETALRYYAVALEKDSEYAAAYSAIAHTWGGLQQMGFVAPGVAQPRMREAVARALALDSTLADAHYTRAGLAVWSDWDWETGEQEFRHAEALDPNDAEGQAAFAHFLYIMRRPTEGWRRIQRALQLDPFNDKVRAFYGVILSQLRRYDDALAEFRRVQVTSPTMPMVLNQIPIQLHFLGRYGESLAAERASWQLRNDTAMVRVLDAGAAAGGYSLAMRRVADELADRAQRSGVGLQRVHASYMRAGDTARAMDWLERAYQAHDPNMPYMAVIPINDPLRGNPRFQALIRRLRLPA
ncbi:MAG TPA: protein kinase [Gemmatimonadales bacterium]|nr:protein kinase [Gemmatimonadales bacterium]